MRMQQPRPRSRHCTGASAPAPGEGRPEITLNAQRLCREGRVCDRLYGAWQAARQTAAATVAASTSPPTTRRRTVPPGTGQAAAPPSSGQRTGLPCLPLLDLPVNVVNVDTNIVVPMSGPPGVVAFSIVWWSSLFPHGQPPGPEPRATDQ